MEISPIRGLPDQLGTMEDPTFLHQWHLNTFEDPTLLPIAAAFGETLLQQYSFCNNNSNFNPRISCIQPSPLSAMERPTKQIKASNTSCWSPNTESDQTSSDLQFGSCPSLFSLVNHNYMNQMGLLKTKEETVRSPKVNVAYNNNNNNNVADVLMSQDSLANQNYGFMCQDEVRKIGTISPNDQARMIGTISPNKVSQPQDHIIAERKRREKLSQRFIALSALVPGLKKMDKASVLGDAIKYMKQLQEKVRILEEEQTKAKTVESVVIVKKSQLFPDAEAADSTCSGSGGSFDGSTLPEIEARFCEKSVLIRIHSEKTKGVLEKAMSVIENLHLTVTNSNAMTFGSSALDITIIAQMDSEFCMTLEDLVGNLRSAFKSFM